MAELTTGRAPRDRVTVSTDQRGTRVTLVGEIDMECQPELDAALRQVLTAPPGPVSVELAELTFLASCGVEFLARLQRAVRPEGPVTLRDPSRVVLRILDITGLTDQFVIVPPPG